ncbi:MAG TPA: class I SAM-dependent RNA methyltransferase, partial [Candidatus Methylopumilus sp.]
MNYQFFATCPRGLEALLVDELSRNQAHKIIAVDGGVSFEGSLEIMYRVNLHSRIATRVLSRVGQGIYTS